MVSAGTLRGTKLTWIRIACMVLLSIALKANSTNHEQEVCLGSSSVSMVCPGDNLTLFCCTNHSALQWFVNISLTPLHFDKGEDGFRVLSEPGPEMERPLTVHPTILHFYKTSNSPLVSVLTIDSVTTNWNQTKIECARGMEGMSLTTIHIIDYSAMIPVVIGDEYFGANNITVTLEWFQNGVVFNNIHPPASVRSVGNRSIQLTIPYNTEHNVSVAVCGQPSPEAIKLYYIACDKPTNDDLMPINYTAPALEGLIIAIECDAMQCTECHHTSTCVEGRWEPSLSQILAMCGGDLIQRNVAAFNNSTLISTIVSALILSILVFFTIGFICGCLCQKYKQLILVLCKTQTDQSSTDLNIKHEQEESQNLEMTENVAYGPVGDYS